MSSYNFQSALSNSSPEILAPLAAVTDLPNHPMLSAPYTSKTLTQLADQISEMMRREQATLWRVKKLMTGFCGDHAWIPSGMLVGPNDIDLYKDDSAFQEFLKNRSAAGQSNNSAAATANVDKRPSVNGTAGSAADTPARATDEKASGEIDVSMVDADPGNQAEKDGKKKRLDGIGGKEVSTERTSSNQSHGESGSSKKTEMKGSSSDRKTKDAKEIPADTGDGRKAKAGSEKPPENNVDMQDANETSTANAAPEAPKESDKNKGNQQQPNATHMGLSDDYPIHPFFTPPSNSQQDRDMGLLENEAENVRHLLSLYVQKQEEVSRGVTKLHHGLLKADRLRQTVLAWSKAEAHVGEMSDGEDWYDLEEWGLDEDLKKGEDEEEEETPTSGKKTTRNRRN